MLKKIFLVVFISIVSMSSSLFAQTDKDMAETVVHLLSYVSMDYAGAVEDGEIIDDMEYLEQQEFCEQAHILTQESAFLSGEDKEEVLNEIAQLITYVDDKESDELISKTANTITNRIIDIVGIKTAPRSWPSIELGRKLYAQTCTQCHGVKGRGDGPQGQTIDPPASDFHDEELMDNFSAYQAYNSIRLGVTGTGMMAYSNFSPEELWALAFYVKSFRFMDQDTSLLRVGLDELAQEIGLQKVADLTDEELLEEIKLVSKENAEQKLAALRTLTPNYQDNQNSIPIAIEGIEAAYQSYIKGEKRTARTQAINAYLEGVEPIESRLYAIDANAVAKVEMQMFNVRQAIDKGVSNEELRAEIDKAIVILDEIDDMLQGQTMNYWLTFILAASIMLREGLEAFLIIAVVIALIRSTGAKNALPWLHGGWILAVIMGIAGWFLVDYIIMFGGKNREIMEGLVSLLAVVVLIFVGFWLHSHSNAQKWKQFVEEKVGKHLQKDRMYGLATFSFMIVFREAFEVILFLQAINLDSNPQNKSAIGLGVIAATILIAIISYLFLKTSRKLPIRQLFKYSSWFIILLAIILIGKGIHSLQESGWIGVTTLPNMIRVQWLGVFPTLQTVLGQLGLIGLIIITYVINNRKLKNE